MQLDVQIWLHRPDFGGKMHLDPYSGGEDFDNRHLGLCLQDLQCKNEDETPQQEIETRSGLENYCPTMRTPLREEQLQDERDGDDKDKPDESVQELLFDAQSWLRHPDYGGKTHPYLHPGGEAFDNRILDLSLQGFKHEDGTNRRGTEARNGLENYCPMQNTLREEKLQDKSKGDDMDKAEKAAQEL